MLFPHVNKTELINMLTDVISYMNITLMCDAYMVAAGRQIMPNLLYTKHPMIVRVLGNTKNICAYLFSVH